MSLKIDQLTKKFGSQTAVNALSLELKKGEIVGFLGPNGAGKSTTMKMLTGYMQPTSGNAYLGGLDVQKDTLQIKERIGYLPENNPLYLDLYVKEYLLFVARIHKITNKQKRVDEVIKLTGLIKEQHKKIKQLSKGYRQRVGLAQAIMHNPEVLILDEPTSGLDPNQLKEIRNLIKSISKDKIVLFSSHILHEVEALCDRVIIIDKGSIIADQAMTAISELQNTRAILSVEFETSIDKVELQNRIKSIRKIEEIGSNIFQIVLSDNTDIRRAVFEYAVSKDNAILSMEMNKSSMEAIFASLTNAN